jgi:hypothetical protein
VSKRISDKDSELEKLVRVWKEILEDMASGTVLGRQQTAVAAVLGTIRAFHAAGVICLDDNSTGKRLFKGKPGTR